METELILELQKLMEEYREEMKEFREEVKEFREEWKSQSLTFFDDGAGDDDSHFSNPIDDGDPDDDFSCDNSEVPAGSEIGEDENGSNVYETDVVLKEAIEPAERRNQQTNQFLTSEIQSLKQQTPGVNSVNPAEFERRMTSETGNNNLYRNLNCNPKLEFPTFEVFTTIASETFDGSPKKEELKVEKLDIGFVLSLTSKFKDEIGLDVEKEFKEWEVSLKTDIDICDEVLGSKIDIMDEEYQDVLRYCLEPINSETDSRDEEFTEAFSSRESEIHHDQVKGVDEDRLSEFYQEHQSTVLNEFVKCGGLGYASKKAKRNIQVRCTSLICASPIGQVGEVLKTQGAQFLLTATISHVVATLVGYWISKLSPGRYLWNCSEYNFQFQNGWKVKPLPWRDKIEIVLEVDSDIKKPNAECLTEKAMNFQFEKNEGDVNTAYIIGNTKQGLFSALVGKTEHKKWQNNGCFKEGLLVKNNLQLYMATLDKDGLGLFVVFNSQEDAKNVMKALNGAIFGSNKALTFISYALSGTFMIASLLMVNKGMEVLKAAGTISQVVSCAEQFSPCTSSCIGVRGLTTVLSNIATITTLSTLD